MHREEDAAQQDEELVDYVHFKLVGFGLLLLIILLGRIIHAFNWDKA